MSGGLKVVPSTSSIYKEDILKGKVFTTSDRTLRLPLNGFPQVFFITGGGSGIGKGMAECMLRHGAVGCIFSRTQERLDKAADQMRKDIPGAQVLAIAGDVRNPVNLEEAMKATVEKFGKLDTLVACAAGNFLAPIEHLSYNAFKTVIDIDLLGGFPLDRQLCSILIPLPAGSFNTIKAAYPYLKKSGNASCIGITATLHYNGTPWQAHPVAAKAGIDALWRTVASELGPYGIVSPLLHAANSILTPIQS